MGTKGQPNNATIRKVLEYLNSEFGLTVYGQCMNRDEDGWCYFYQSLGDYDIDDIIALRKALREGKVVDMTQPET